MKVLIFEDPKVSQLSPITLTRPAYLVTCGACRLIDQLQRPGHLLAAVVRSDLQALVAADSPDLADLPAWRRSVEQDNSRVLLVNARIVPSAVVRKQLEELWDAGDEGIVRTHRTVAAALLPARELAEYGELTVEQVSRGLEASELPTLHADLPLLEYPHDVIRHHLSSMGDNLNDLLARRDYHQPAPYVYAPRGLELPTQLAVETSGGPIVIEQDVVVGPFCFLEGPLYISRGARICEHSSIQALTYIGHNSKVGGELCASIVEPYSNKQHDGYLGHSYLGSWVNVGAGTCVSDLKNTYGKINVDCDGQRIATEMQFLGAIVADHVKMAINSTIFAGKQIGVASMVYGTITENVPSFVNYAQSLGQVTAASVEAIATMQRRMFARRNIQQRTCDVALLQAIFDATASQRSGMADKVAPLRFG
jgi:glucose-1-phosphate thymidylyltransferase